jgi:hypothetical protein
MIFSEYLGLVYYPVSKCASSSIKAAILKACDVGEQLVAHPVKNPHRNLPTRFKQCHQVEPGKITLHKGRSPDLVKGLVSFAVIRHPLDRLVSCFVNKIEGKRPGIPERYRGARRFSDFATLVLETPADKANLHFRPQHYLLPKEVMYLFQMESLKKNWEALCAAIGHQLDLPDLNVSPHASWKSYYSPRLRKDAAAYYEEDMVLWSTARS